MKIGFIGIGKMTTAIITGLKTSPYDIIISDKTLQSSQEKAKQLGVDFAENHQDLVNTSDLVIIGVKPQIFPELFNKVNFSKPILSIAAGITLERLRALTTPDLPIIRIMPNLNAELLQSTTAICRNAFVSDDLYNIAKTIVNSFGTSFDLPEKDFDTFTALAGSSPAYIALFIEAMAQAGVAHGLSKDLCLQIINQTMQATSQNMRHQKPHEFIDRVASPGGTTITGLVDLEKTGFTASVLSAIEMTIKQSKNL